MQISPIFTHINVRKFHLHPNIILHEYSTVLCYCGHPASRYLQAVLVVPDGLQASLDGSGWSHMQPWETDCTESIGRASTLIDVPKSIPQFYEM